MWKLSIAVSSNFLETRTLTSAYLRPLDHRRWGTNAAAYLREWSSSSTLSGRLGNEDSRFWSLSRMAALIGKHLHREHSPGDSSLVIEVHTTARYSCGNERGPWKRTIQGCLANAIYGSRLIDLACAIPSNKGLNKCVSYQGNAVIPSSAFDPGSRQSNLKTD